MHSAQTATSHSIAVGDGATADVSQGGRRSPTTAPSPGRSPAGRACRAAPFDDAPDATGSSGTQPPTNVSYAPSSPGTGSVARPSAARCIDATSGTEWEGPATARR